MSESSVSLWDLAVLGVLRERPMHPYEIQRLLKERHKDEILVLKRGSLYHAIRRLENIQLIESGEIARNGRRPEHTTYRITPAGERALIEWLRRSIAVPQRERSDFLGSISFLVYLTPEESAVVLEQRAGLLEAEIAALDASLESAGQRVGRINIIESEYARAMRAAELEWVRGIVSDLRAGRFTWSLDEILQQARS
jgi:DNA-binding PadR family transcriptional regulator